MTNQPAMLCTSCKKQKSELKKKNSKLLPGTQLFLCKTCLESRFEPRAFIIMAGRDQQDISYWLKPKRYVGDEITARELL